MFIFFSFTLIMFFVCLNAVMASQIFLTVNRLYAENPFSIVNLIFFL